MATIGRCLIGGDWREADGPSLRSTDPAETRTLWEGRAAGPATVAAAVEAAAQAAPGWAALSLEARRDHLERVIAVIDDRGNELAAAISAEVGKPTWEGKTEVASVRGKLAASIAAYEERATGATRQVGAASAVTRFRPLGVAAVLGPFNFPAHMPNGHIIPALLAGNTVVFKPSNLCPLAGEVYASLWADAGLPGGVFNLVQGGGDTGAALVQHPDISGIFFNGSRATGVAISRSVADHPEKLLVLEMGGSNPLVVWDYDDLAAAVFIAVQSCYVTAGQRCTAARRLIVRDEDEALLEALRQTVSELRVSTPDADPAPFMGPVVSKDAARRLLGEQAGLIQRGGAPILEMAPTSDGLPYLQPGLIDMTLAHDAPDEEIFGPLLQVHRVGSFDEALSVASGSRFGLAAGIVCRERERFEEFAASTRAGIVNWNQQLTGASGLAPFGGLRRVRQSSAERVHVGRLLLGRGGRTPGADGGAPGSAATWVDRPRVTSVSEVTNADAAPYERLDALLRDVPASSVGFTQLIATQPYVLDHSDVDACRRRHDALTEYFDRSIEVFAAALGGEASPELARLLLNETADSFGADFHRRILAKRRTRPQFFRTDEVGPGRIVEIQCPGSLWGDYEAVAALTDGRRVPSLAKGFCTQLRRLLGDDMCVHHLLDNASAPHSNRYFIERTRPPVRYFGLDGGVSQLDCRFVRSHSFFGLVGENFFRPRLKLYLAGELTFDLPPLIIFDEKITLTLPFMAETRDLYSDAVRDALVFSAALTPDGFATPDGDWITLEQFAAEPRRRRRWFLKYAGSDVSLNWGSRGVATLDNLGREHCLRSLREAAHAGLAGHIWLVQPMEQQHEEVEFSMHTGIP